MFTRHLVIASGNTTGGAKLWQRLSMVTRKQGNARKSIVTFLSSPNFFYVYPSIRPKQVKHRILSLIVDLPTVKMFNFAI